MKKQLFILSFAMLSILSARATNLVVKPLSGADYQRELGTIGKLAYHGDSIYLYDSFGTLLYSEQLAKVHQLTYSDNGDHTTSLTDTPADLTNLRVYPNPTAETLVVEGLLAEEGQARLYNQQGQLLKTATLTNPSTTMDVSNLPAGSYLLLCNGDAFKIIIQ